MRLKTHSATNKLTLMGTVTNQKVDLRICDCGLAEYRKILNLQLQLQAQHLQVSKEELKKRKIALVETRRGGGVTAHNPGQVVFYPILNLQQLNLCISEYIRRLESTGTELLGQFGVKSKIRKGYPGLWVGEKKIASIGVRVSRFVTYHGMAININNDLGIFDLFIPCGIDGVKMTSVLKQTGKKYSMNDVKGRLAKLLTKYFTVKSGTYENRSQVTSMA